MPARMSSVTPAAYSSSRMSDRLTAVLSIIASSKNPRTEVETETRTEPTTEDNRPHAVRQRADMCMPFGLSFQYNLARKRCQAKQAIAQPSGSVAGVKTTYRCGRGDEDCGVTTIRPAA